MNICWCAWLTSVTVQETEYNEMTKLSMTVMPSEEGVSGLGHIHQMAKRGGELWPRAPFLRKQISLPCQERSMCYLILSGHGTMYHLMTFGDAHNCTWTDLATPTIAGVNYAKHWEESI